MNLRRWWNYLRGKKSNPVVGQVSMPDSLTFSLSGPRSRGMKQIVVGMLHEQKAAQRNGHKPHWRQESLASLFKKLREEVDEMESAFLNESNKRKLDEYGDVKWTATMIADHDYLLGTWEEKPPWTLPE